MTARLFASLSAAVGALFLGTESLSGQASGGPALTVVREMFGFGMVASGAESTNFVLESSADLKSWTNVFQAYGWPGTNPVYQVQDVSRSPAEGFWRAKAGEPLLVQEQRWNDHQPAEYSFRLRHVISFWQGGVQGTVRVLNGVVVEVVDAVNDQTLQPIVNPDLSQFFTITQLFEQIRQAFEAGDQRVIVQYDPGGGVYPEYILVDPWILAVDDESVFEVSEFTVLQP